MICPSPIRAQNSGKTDILVVDSLEKPRSRACVNRTRDRLTNSLLPRREHALMAVSKRTRFEVLKRDNHTCRYCGAIAPDAKITVDHVTPVALGGTDDPSNLVAACRDCNYGKGSTAPDAATVEDVKQVDIKWGNAIKRVAAARARQHKKEDAYCVTFLDHWNTWRTRGDAQIPMDPNWEAGIRRFYQMGVPIDELIRCADIACGNQKIGPWDTYRYFAGCVWRVVTEMQDAAKALLEAEEN